jgi:hypothetical protein
MARKSQTSGLSVLSLYPQVHAPYQIGAPRFGKMSGVLIMIPAGERISPVEGQWMAKGGGADRGFTTDPAQLAAAQNPDALL